MSESFLAKPSYVGQYDTLVLWQLTPIIICWGWMAIALIGPVVHLWGVNFDSFRGAAETDPTGYFTVASWIFYQLVSPMDLSDLRFGVGAALFFWGFVAGLILSPLGVLVCKVRWYLRTGEWPWWPYVY